MAYISVHSFCDRGALGCWYDPAPKISQVTCRGLLGNGCNTGFPVYRWLVKKQRDEQALKILTKIYKGQSLAQNSLEEIRATANAKKEPFVETLRYMMQWKILQRYLSPTVFIVYTQLSEQQLPQHAVGR
jgi:hypothetical protein